MYYGGIPMARRYASSTRLEIVQAATTLFLDNGFSNTSAKLLCDQLNISTGNLTFYFPTKEHLLAVLVEMLCDFQKVLAFKAARGGAVRYSSRAPGKHRRAGRPASCARGWRRRES